MNRRTAARLAWSLWGLFVAFIAISVLFGLLDGPPQNADDSEFWGFGVLLMTALLSFATVGSLVAARHPENPIGWLFCIFSIIFGLGAFAEGYARHTLQVAPGSLPGGAGMAWVVDWTRGAILLDWFIFLLLLFPTGRLLTRRWRLVAWLAVGIIVADFLSDLLRPGPLTTFTTVTNPVGIDALSSVADDIQATLFWFSLAGLLLSAASLILRLQRAHGDERQQLKWFASAGALLATIWAVAPIIWLNPAIPQVLWSILFLIGVSAIPVAAGVAILKYRLYEIDFIINRALVYGALTAALVLVYLGSVVVLQTLFHTLAGEDSQVAIVASTLAIAALFTPLRRRIQAAIDKRFYRRKYDAAKTLTAFSAQLRDEVDLNALTGELLAVIEETIQPAHVSLWLREAPHRSSKDPKITRA